MEQMLEILGTYGAPLVITGIVLYGALRVMNIFLGRLEKENKKNSEREEHDRLLAVRQSIDKSINASLENVLLRTNSDRVFLFEFHNGGQNITGLPFLKMSNTYEVVDTGIIPQRFNLEQMSLSMYFGVITEIISKPFLVINVNARDSSIPAICYETLLAQGVHTCAMSKIVDLKGRVIGYCGIDFVREEKQIRGNSDIKLITEMATECGALLSLDD